MQRTLIAIAASSAALAPTRRLQHGGQGEVVTVDQAPTQIVGASESAAWAADTSEAIVGWGATSEGGDTPDRLTDRRREAAAASRSCPLL